MIRFIHTADIHYGMENYGIIDPATGIHSRLLDFDRAFNFVIDTAIENNVDFFLIAGDAYKTTNPSPTQQRLFFKSLLRLHHAHIPVIIVVGNHDNPLSFGKANTLDILGDLPLNNFYVISKPATISLLTKNGPVNIVGIPWPTRNTIALSNSFNAQSTGELNNLISNSVSNLIKTMAEELDSTIPAILTAHLTVDNGIFSGSEKRAVHGHDPLFTSNDLAISPFDYVALGHLHRFQQINTGYPPIVYSGSVERIDFGERKEEKGFCLVTIKSKNNTSYEFIKTPQRPFIQIDVSLRHDYKILQTEQLIQAIKSHDLKNAIVKITYHVPPEVKDTVDISTIQQHCTQAHDLIGIIPVYPIKQHTFRGSLANRADMDFISLLDLFLNQKTELKERKTVLIEKALQLKEQISSENQASGGT